MPRQATRPQTADDVIAELHRRVRAGRALNSGANRGDWLYAAAVRFFDSWGSAVRAAGFDYASVKIGPLGPEVVLQRLRDLAEKGDRLVAREHRSVAVAARRHFGSWDSAAAAAGCRLPDRGIWTRETIFQQVREDVGRGLRMRPSSVIARRRSLYVAGRRLFGSWKATLKAARKVGIFVDPGDVRGWRRRTGASASHVSTPSS